MFEGRGLRLEQKFPCFRNEEESAEALGATRVAGAALPPPTASGGRNHPIITMTYSHGLWRDKEEDAGPPVCFFLLSEQELGGAALSMGSPPSREDV